MNKTSTYITNSMAQKARNEELKNMTAPEAKEELNTTYGKFATKVCDECPNEAGFRIINGDDTTTVCKLCAQEIIFEMVTENEHTDFHSYTKEGETILTIE